MLLILNDKEYSNYVKFDGLTVRKDINVKV